MFVVIPGSIPPPVRLGPGETDPPDGSISPVTYIQIYIYIELKRANFMVTNLILCSDIRRCLIIVELHYILIYFKTFS